MCLRVRAPGPLKSMQWSPGGRQFGFGSPEPIQLCPGLGARDLLGSLFEDVRILVSKVSLFVFFLVLLSKLFISQITRIGCECKRKRTTHNNK